MRRRSADGLAMTVWLSLPPVSGWRDWDGLVWVALLRFVARELPVQARHFDPKSGAYDIQDKVLNSRRKAGGLLCSRHSFVAARSERDWLIWIRIFPHSLRRRLD